MLSEELLSQISLVVFRFSRGISFLLGLAPCCIKISTDSPTKIGFHCEFLYSRCGLVYNIFFITGLTLMMIFSVPLAIKDYATKQLVMLMIKSAAPVLGHLATIFVVFIYTIYQRRVVAIGNELSEFDRKFATKLCENCNTQIFTVGEFWNVLLILVAVFMTVGLFVSSIFVYNIVELLPCVLCLGVNGCFLTQYTLIVNILKQRVRCLNDACIAVVGAPIVTEETSSFLDNKLNCTNFRLMRKSWNTMYKISCDISDLYSLPVLVTIFFYCVGSLNTLYFGITLFAYIEKFSFNAASTSTVLWFLIHVYPIVILCDSVKRLLAEMDKTADTIYDVLDTYEEDNAIVPQLKDFSIELLHKKVKFTAYGLFSLDCTLIQSIFGTLVTYLLIMFQFQPAEVAAEII